VDNETIFINGTCEHRFSGGLNITDYVLTVNESGIYRNSSIIYAWCKYDIQYGYFFVFVVIIMLIPILLLKKRKGN
jgi:hypothetical protein